MTDPEYAELDLAVARAEIAAGHVDVKIADTGRPTIMLDAGGWEPFRPTVHWGHAGPIIEEHWPQIALQLRAWFGDGWANASDVGRGEPMLPLFMRAYVASRA